MRILFVIDSLGYGGAERQLVELVKGLSKESFELHVVSLIAGDTGYSEILASEGIEVIYFPRAHRFDLVGPLFRLARFIRENQVELVHGFMNMGSLFGALAAKVTNRPVICSAVRDAKDSSRREKYLKRFISGISDVFVSNSRAGFTNRFPVLKPHFRVVHNGVDFSRFASGKDDRGCLRDSLGISGLSPVVGMVGSFSSHKDQETLLKAAPKILSAFPSTGFLFVGDGANRGRLEQKTAALRLDDNVVFAGIRKDVDRIYPLMDVCVLLTNSRIFLEGIPNVLIEAMGCGVPVVASDGGGTPEVVTHDATGILVPPGDSGRVAEEIIKLLSNREMACSVANAGRTSVHKLFGLERYLVEYQQIYSETLRIAP